MYEKLTKLALQYGMPKILTAEEADAEVRRLRALADRDYFVPQEIKMGLHTTPPKDLAYMTWPEATLEDVRGEIFQTVDPLTGKTAYYTRITERTTDPAKFFTDTDRIEFLERKILKYGNAFTIDLDLSIADGLRKLVDAAMVAELEATSKPPEPCSRAP